MLYISFVKIEIYQIGQREKGRRILKKYINFTHFTPKLPHVWGGGRENYNSLSPYHTDRWYRPNLIKVGPIVLKKMLTHDGRRLTPTHRNKGHE